MAGHMSLPLYKRFSSPDTEARYFAKYPERRTTQIYAAGTIPPQDESLRIYDETMPAAWRAVRAFVKIEAGIDRLIVASLCRRDAPPELARHLSSAFEFDQRLRIVERLVKKNKLVLQPEFESVEVPYPLPSPMKTFEAIRCAMSYRNRLVHDGLYMFVLGNEQSYTESVWVDSANAKKPGVPIMVDVHGRPSLMRLAESLGAGLPFFTGPRIFDLADDLFVDPGPVIDRAVKAAKKSAEHRAQGHEQAVGKLRDAIANNQI